MIRYARLYTGQVHYGERVALHTAASGAIAHLDELYLVIESEGGVIALGGIRTNVEYLTGIPGEEVRRQAIDWLSSVVKPADFSQLLDLLHSDAKACAPACALLDQTFHDGLARERGCPLCGLWDKTVPDGISTNQTLFWSDDEKMLGAAAAYVRRGFKTLKLRMGIRTFDDDLRRLGKLRAAFGDRIDLAGDVNGQWDDDDALGRITALAPYDLKYLEQPVAASSWEAVARLATTSPIQIMLDESVSSAADVERVIEIGGNLAAHLKLIKLGGLRPLIAAGRKLVDNGVPIMVGQMNEGALATAAAAHAAIALDAQGNELYGADRIVDDPAESPRYENGRVYLPDADGIGLELDTSKTTMCWQREYGTGLNEPRHQRQTA